MYGFEFSNGDLIIINTAVQAMNKAGVFHKKTRACSQAPRFCLLLDEPKDVVIFHQAPC